MDRSDAGMPRQESDGASLGLDPRAMGCLYTLALALALVPIFVTPVLPLVDLPNHLARVHILNHLDTSAALQKYYSTDWHLLSYQLVDLLMPALARAFGLFAAAQICTAATFILLFGGTIALHWVLFRRFGLLPLASVLFLYSFPLAFGFLSYLFSTGVALLLLSGWIATEGRSKPLRVLAFTLGGLALLVLHFFAFAAYAVLVASYEFGRIWRDRAKDLKRGFARLVEAGLPFLVPCAIVLTSFDDPVPSVTEWGSPTALSGAAISPTVLYWAWPDLVVTGAVVLGFMFWWHRRQLQLAPAMGLPLLAMAVTGAFMPVWLLGVWGANFRIPVLLAFLLAAAIALRFRKRMHLVLFVCGVFAALLLRVVTVIDVWHGYDRDFSAFRAAAAQIERGSRVLALPLPEDRGTWPVQIYPYAHVAALSVIDRDVFLPSLFTLATPLRFTSARRGLTDDVHAVAAPLEWHPSDPRFASTPPETVRAVEALSEAERRRDAHFSQIDWSRWPEDYDYLIIFTFGRPASNPVPALLTPVAEGSFFVIFRVHPPQAGADKIP